jgi:hypothetical protein
MEQSSGRGQDGKFVKGNSLGHRWKKGESGNTSGASFAFYCQFVVDKSELIPMLAELALGMPPFQKAALADRLKAAELLLDRAYGRPRPAMEAIDISQPILVKRVIGIDDSKV